MTPPLAPWPTYRDFAVKHGPTSLASELYNNALAAAWEARARLAVDALLDIEDSREISGEQRRWVGDKLCEIGPLPPLPDLPTAETA